MKKTLFIFSLLSIIPLNGVNQNSSMLKGARRYAFDNLDQDFTRRIRKLGRGRNRRYNITARRVIFGNNGNNGNNEAFNGVF
jgi:hypothetical protein